ncbi:MAG: hypothetical protein HY889_02335 [Deltaproteobacteria bacterium]|nr:hypothetical protein [Deltaproteobacteria bacterium]
MNKYLVRFNITIIVILLLITGCVGSLPTPEQLANENFGECPANYKERIMAQINENLFDPYSAMYRFSEPEKYVSGGKFGKRVVVYVNAKNRFGGYVGEEIRNYMCFTDGSVTEINQFATGMVNGMQKGMR